jgi:hypothetical protein
MRGLFVDKDLKRTARDSGEVSAGSSAGHSAVTQIHHAVLLEAHPLALRPRKVAVNKQDLLSLHRGMKICSEKGTRVLNVTDHGLYRNNETSESVSSLATASSVLPRGRRHPALNNEETYFGM